MNQKVERSDQEGVSGLGTPLDVLRRRSDFRGPVGENEDDEHANDHFALVYENRDDQFSAVIPFIREGLDWGERCLYIADENTRDVVLEAMRARGIDVDAALDSGALSIHTPAETYRKTGEFDRDAMLAYWEDALEQATDQNDFNGVRAAAEMTWALDDDTDLDLLTEYEAILNSLYEGEAYTVMCQYNRDRFPAGVLRDVVKTHPHVVSRDTVSRNVYYTPPERFFGPKRPDDDLDRMLETLRDRTQAKAELEERQRYLRKSYEITSDPELSFEEKLESLFELGCARFDLELGGLARIDPDTDLFEVEAVSGDHDHLEPSARVALSETYCRVLGEGDETAGVTDPVADGFDGTLAYEEFGVDSYLGTRIELEDDLDRSLFFVSSEPRDTEFSEAERTFLHLMGQWVQYELERRQKERALEETVTQLQQSNDRLKQFAYAASHDLQEPLRMVSSYLQLLDDRYSDDLDEDAREFIDFAVDGADRMRAMVEDLLAYSRVEQSEGSFEPVDCEALLEDVLDDVQARIEETDATVVVDSLPTVSGDREQLEQLFSNLVSNAIKYNDAETPHVDITATRRDDSWEFAVADDGIGIAPDKRDRIFEVFKRLHHDAEYPGTGIGLSLCQEIVENHGGDIWVESEPGVGSTFSFTLPRRAET